MRKDGDKSKWWWSALLTNHCIHWFSFRTAVDTCRTVGPNDQGTHRSSAPKIPFKSVDTMMACNGPLPTTALHASSVGSVLVRHTLHIRYDNNTRATTAPTTTAASMVMPAVATTFVSKPKQAKDLLTLLRFADITNAKLLSYILLRDTEKSETVHAFRAPPDGPPSIGGISC